MTLSEVILLLHFLFLFFQEILHKGVLVFILLAVIVEAIIREIIVLAVGGGGNAVLGGVIAVVSFVVSLVFVFGTMVVVNIIYYCIIRLDKDVFFRVFALAIYSLGSVLYYYGDNINDIMQLFGSELGCGPTCRLNNRIAAIIASGTALLIIKKYPGVQMQFHSIVGYKDKAQVWFSAAEMIVLFVIFDALFNTVVAAAQETGRSCGAEDIGVEVAFLVILVVVGALFVTINCIFAIKKSDKKVHPLICVTYIVVLISLPLFLLANNRQPLDCAFGCHTLGRNATGSVDGCNSAGAGGLRLVILILLLIGISTISLLLFLNRNKSEASKEPEGNKAENK